MGGDAHGAGGEEEVGGFVHPLECGVDGDMGPVGGEGLAVLGFGEGDGEAGGGFPAVVAPGCREAVLQGKFAEDGGGRGLGGRVGCGIGALRGG